MDSPSSGELDPSRRASLIRAISFNPESPVMNRNGVMVSPVVGGALTPTSVANHVLIRKASTTYDASTSMNRLRASMMGAPEVPTLADTTITPYSSSVSLASSSNLQEVPRNSTKRSRKRKKTLQNKCMSAMGQIPAIALIAMFHLMIGIPFGVSYFPMSWSPYVEEATDEAGPFPLPGKESLGIRMFLFSTIIGQIVFTLTSNFKNPIGLQMVENVPFCHELANIVIAHQGYGVDAISTLIVMFGLSSLLVGIVFWILGRRNLGRVIYFFPSHVLIGCIGGIGVFLAKTGLEVTMADMFSVSTVVDKWNVLWVVFVFEAALRLLERLTKDKDGKAKYALLSPIYFCMITPIFYLGLKVFSITIDQANSTGFFFPPLDSEPSEGEDVSAFWQDAHIWDMWTVIDIPSVSWAAIRDSFPTLLALVVFSLIHVPINIPAFSLSTKTEVDMNNELIAHGYSNMIAGMFGGLQNYMAYTQSVLYDKSGGTGQASGFAVAATTSILFFVGPTIASYIPRCMAGTLLLHVGIDLFLESVWDSYGKFDHLEYSGILLIAVIMTLYGMEAAMMAGVIAAVSTYAVQSVAYLSPIRGSMPATTLCSSQINRSHSIQSILNSPSEGRSRILVVQLQGHLFFGNMASFTESMHSLVKVDTTENKLAPVVIIIDCSLVLGIDSSAGQAISKLKDSLLKKTDAELFIFVTGSNAGFPTQYPLSQKLATKTPRLPLVEEGEMYSDRAANYDETTLLLQNIETNDNVDDRSKYCGSHVCHSLDEALTYAEEALVARSNPALLKVEEAELAASVGRIMTPPSDAEDKRLASNILKKICSVDIPDEDVKILVSLFDREVYSQGNYVWRQHEESNCAKLLISGILLAELENEAGTTETISPGNLVGELGLLNGDARMSSVKCLSDEAIVYSLNRTSFDQLVLDHPRIARYLDLICIRYLAFRVQHVSNRIFETRCLPI